MKKSILLSSFIMLIILFVTLSTTTFAWYQASGGSIDISGSSTASVTTTGPDSPYLLISSSSTGEWTSQTTEPVSSKIHFDAADNSHTLEYFNVEAEHVFGHDNLKFRNPITGELGNPYYFTFYLRVTASTFPLSTTVQVLSGASALTGYSYALTFSSNVKNSTNTSDVTYLNSAYTLSNGTAISPTSFDIVISGTSVIEVNFYLWLDGGEATSSNSSLQTAVLSNLSVVFSNVGIFA